MYSGKSRVVPRSLREMRGCTVVKVGKITGAAWVVLEDDRIGSSRLSCLRNMAWFLLPEWPPHRPIVHHWVPAAVFPRAGCSCGSAVGGLPQLLPNHARPRLLHSLGGTTTVIHTPGSWQGCHFLFPKRFPSLGPCACPSNETEGHEVSETRWRPL